MIALTSGAGLCRVEGLLALAPAQAVFELGAGPDVIRDIFAAVHAVNRHAPSDDYLALALPEMVSGRGFDALGRSVEVFGSERALSRLMTEAQFRKLLSRGMLPSRQRIREINFAEGDCGTWLARTRSGEKESEGWKAKDARRRERRADHIASVAGRFPDAQAAERADRKRDLYLRLPSGVFLAMRRGVAPWTGQPVIVSSYGLSQESAPSVLPSRPVTVKRLHEVA
ncbi:type I-F CRISPR-associated endoribonuclease Cas6/Csy4 [Defluviimonas salinarum]|uniref:Type I-F CRISPR-associated endoribonuclease Cas6/Csy4 n=1 Tax=Defluviimonas salinarum TaxID=2992147 RepID=A0ABT3JA22_9RHOB|nr:type I-F CRISPR-associated endoribonuclease Cas6/Csy4 [Defluviimonas salinarum]MCW3784383.1 type I-F CRISPR-associated endoribonuclease Cas6/Csy4 [Defluviimonas salinarum]